MRGASIPRTFLLGLLHSIALHRLVRPFVASRKVRFRLAQTIVLNGVLFLGGVYLFKHYARAIAHVALPWLEQAGLSAGDIRFWDKAARITTTAQFEMLWTIPIYVVSLILNTIWCQDIADQTYAVTHGSTVVEADFREIIRDMLYRALLFAVVSVQALLVDLLPTVGRPLSLFMWSWIYAFNAFEYKWCTLGLSLAQRVAACERCWAYMAGFGAICSAATLFVPMVTGLGLYALLFPLIIVLAVHVDPLPVVSPHPQRSHAPDHATNDALAALLSSELQDTSLSRLRIFWLGERLVNMLLVRIGSHWLPRRPIRDRRVRGRRRSEQGYTHHTGSGSRRRDRDGMERAGGLQERRLDRELDRGVRTRRAHEQLAGARYSPR
mmetsp:Transcript_12628/g.40333  ORF Transcript_12628/g.40333 Transcript_12628/m.40333 type:complete len:381 (+) Transcript_12628:1-1143(+)